MDEPGDHIHVPDSVPALENEREVAEFVEAMQGAFEQDAPIEVFRNLIQDAPVVPIDEYYTLAISCVNQKSSSSRRFASTTRT